LANNSSTAVVIFQLGGPDGPEAVKPFLYNLFCDPDIIDLPAAFLFRKLLAKMISTFRSPKVIELYKHIGGKSPILEQTNLQADALRKYLKTQGRQLPVYVAMRYWYPFTDEIADEIIREGFNKLILVPLYPHYSKSTTGSSYNELKRILKKKKVVSKIELTLIHSYPENPDYIESMVERINEAAQRFPSGVRNNIQLVFSAHGTPMALVRQGDPYSHQIRQTYEAVMKQGRFEQPSTLCFQSKVGPQKWLEPSLIDTIDRLGKEGIKNMLIIPIAFVSEHLETLSEIGLEGKKQAMDLGVEQFEVMPALLDHPKFIKCLGDLVIEKLDLKAVES
jgi:protoporphyrin/coproporphyrin ferrochelatase